MNGLRRHAAVALCGAMISGALGFAAMPAGAVQIAVTNAGFEDTSGQTVFNEFTFGTPAGWGLYDPNGIFPNASYFPGTLQPNGTDFFSQTAPEGDRVAILFNFAGSGGIGEYGFEQTLGDTLQANTRYTLTVEVGDIDSGVDSSSNFYDLEGFPGYRIDLLAGANVIASDLNSLAGSIVEGTFATATVTIDIGAASAFLDQDLGIRLVNLNNPQGPSDLEVDFDDVQLTAVALPVPAIAPLMALGLAGLFAVRRRSV